MKPILKVAGGRDAQLVALGAYHDIGRAAVIELLRESGIKARHLAIAIRPLVGAIEQMPTP